MWKIRDTSNLKTLYLVLFILSFLIYWFSGEGHPTYYDYYVRLSNAFLHGRLYVLEQPPWLNELIPRDGGFYVVYPPLPAVVMTPLVAVCGKTLNQTLVSVFVGSLCVVKACVIAKDIVNVEHSTPHVWLAVLFGFGTIFWYLASVGSAWYLAHVMSVFFLFMAIHEALNRGRPLLVGLLVGASYWCRLPTILALLFFAVLIVINQQWNLKKALLPLLKLVLGASVFVGLNMVYNYIRFGTLFDMGYWLIPGILDEPWFSKGLFSILYIPENLAAIFLGLPRFIPEPPFVLPLWTGMAIWITTPAFIYAFKSNRKEAITVACWLTIIAVALVIFSKGCSGWGFGYRYAMDFYPFLYILTVKGIGERIEWHHKALIILSVLVNLWGIVWVNKFGWWT
jgi:uncharacterized membrane protein (GlpM family)